MGVVLLLFLLLLLVLLRLLELLALGLLLLALSRGIGLALLLLGSLGSEGDLTELLGDGLLVGDEDVGEDRAGLHLPDLDTDDTNVVVGVDLRVVAVLGVGDDRVHPRALVGRVGDLARRPLALVLGVGDARGLPLAVELLVPVVGLLGVGVGDELGDIVPALRLDVLRIVDLLLVDPVLESTTRQRPIVSL